MFIEFYYIAVSICSSCYKYEWATLLIEPFYLEESIYIKHLIIPQIFIKHQQSE